MASVNDWAAVTMSIIRNRRLSIKEEEKFFKQFLIGLHPDQFRQTDQETLNALADDMRNALATARNNNKAPYARTYQHTQQDNAWNTAGPTPWSFATPTPVLTPNQTFDWAWLGAPSAAPVCFQKSCTVF